MPLVTFSPGTKIKSNDVNTNFAGLADGSLDNTSNSLIELRRRTFFDHCLQGLTIATSANLTSTITAGLAIINGKYVSTLLTNKTFTASKDTYVDLKDDGTFVYVEVANGATTGMTLTLNSDGSNAMRIAKVITSASAITAVYQTDQAQASSTLTDLGWAGLDPLGNPVRNTSPTEMVFRVTRHNGTATRSSLANASLTQIPNMQFNYKTGGTRERILPSFSTMSVNNAVGGNYIQALFINGASASPSSYTDKPSTGTIAWSTNPIEVHPQWFAAGTTISFQLMYQHSAGATYTNANNDQFYTMPTIQIRVSKQA